MGWWTTYWRSRPRWARMRTRSSWGFPSDRIGRGSKLFATFTRHPASPLEGSRVSAQAEISRHDAIDPFCHREERPRRAGDGHLQSPAEGPDHFFRYGGERRGGKLDCGTDVVFAIGRTEGGHSSLHQFAGGERDGGAGDLRHDAVCDVRRGDVLPWSGGEHGSGAADGGSGEQAAGACRTRGS